MFRDEIYQYGEKYNHYHFPNSNLKPKHSNLILAIFAAHKHAYMVTHEMYKDLSERLDALRRYL